MSTLRLYLYHLITQVLPESRCFGLKNTLLRWAGAKIGKNVRIYSSTLIVGNGTLEIGDDVHIGARATILPGVTLPCKTLVAAGAVVTKSPLNLQPQPPTSGLLLAGVPAEVKKAF